MATSDDRRLIDNASATTVDNFYGNQGGKDVQIPLATAASVLADVMTSETLFPFMSKGNITDANNVGGGIYTINIAQSGKVSNIPSVVSYGVLVCFEGLYSYSMQLLADVINGKFYVRYNNGAWSSEWVKITTTAV